MAADGHLGMTPQSRVTLASAGLFCCFFLSHIVDFSFLLLYCIPREVLRSVVFVGVFVLSLVCSFVNMAEYLENCWR